METTMIRDIHELKAAAEAAGSHFFDADAMRFFDSRILSGVYTAKDGGVLFVTSERFHGSGGFVGPRLYTVRKFTAGGGRSVDTVGKFQEHATARAARKAAREASF